MTEEHRFPVFITVTLGTRKPVEALVQELEARGYVGEQALKMLTKVSISPTRVELDLVNVSGADLGFTRQTRIGNVYARAQELGLQLCPAEVGPVLRLSYSHHQGEPREYGFGVAMEPINVSDRSGIFAVERHESPNDGNVRGLSSWDFSYPGKFVCVPEHQWIFVQPRSQP